MLHRLVRRPQRCRLSPPALLVVLLAVLAGLTSPGTTPAETPSHGTKAVVSAAETATLERLESEGARLVADRGAYRVYDVPAVRRDAVAVLPGVVLRDDFDTISLRRAPLHTSTGDAGPTGPFAGVPAPRRLKLIQFPAPPSDADLARVRDTGAQLVHYVPQNAYIVWTEDDKAAASLAKLAGTPGQADGLLQFVGDYRLDHVIAPQLDERLADSSPVVVTVQVFDYGKAGDGSRTARGDLDTVIALSDGLVSGPWSGAHGTYLNARIATTGTMLLDLARVDSVVNIEPWIAPEKFDERQDLVMAGRDNGTLPTLGDGYLAWLASRGFPTTPASYPVIGVNDDGTGNGTINSGDNTLHQGGNIANPTRVLHVENATADAAGNGRDGHGHINISIVGGFDDRDGAPFTDAGGFRRALGVSPYGRMASTKVFRDNNGPFDLSRIGGDDTDLIRFNYENGERISTNSWGAPVGGAYDVSAQDFDAGTRDALPSTTGNQQLFYLFAAGNAGSSANTIGSPGTAKNVLTVGASENTDADGNDGCNLGPSDANNMQDVAWFSSRGPTDDARIKPDIIAPGTHIQGTASTDPNFNGNGVCDQFWPAGQTILARSSGTSHSTPAVAGFASLASEFLVRHYGFDLPGSGGENQPSPALLKAYMIHGGRHLTGSGANDNFPSNSQGWGFVGGDLVLDTRAPRFFLDQSHAFDSSGETRSFFGTVPESGEPVRIVLAWTDAPGATTGAAYVNDLNLTVTVDGETYLGNRFTLGTSQPGGSPDFRNNVEAVYLPAGLSGAIAITIDAMSIVGDGVPGSGDATDQDFALVAYNFVETPTPFFEATGNVTIVDTDGNGNDNGMADPGENAIDLTIELTNTGTSDATDLIANLTAISPTATVTSGVAPFGDLPMNGTSTNLTPFTIALRGDHVCGAPIFLRLEVSSAEGSNNVLVRLDTGVPNPSIEAFDFEDALPTGWTAGGAWARRDVASSSATSTTSGTFLVSSEPIPNTTSDARLVTSAFSVGAGSELSFWHTFASEARYDGGRIEISTSGPTGPWTDLGPHIVAGGYNNTVNGSSGPAAWSGGSIGAMTQVRVDLGAFAGQSAHFAFRLTSDASVTVTPSGWFLDDVQVGSVDYTCATPPVSLRLASVWMDDDQSGNAVNGYLDPGETVALAIDVENLGLSDATSTTAILSTTHPHANVLTWSSPYSIPGGATGTNDTPFLLSVDDAANCGDKIDLMLVLTSDQGAFHLPVVVRVGQDLSATIAPASTDVPRAINDNATATSTLVVTETGVITDLNVSVNLTHTYVGDLIVSLQSPSGTVVRLFNRRGGGGDDFAGTVFDDEAGTAITAGTPPYTGSFRPEEPLSAFDGEEVTGTWTLLVSDNAAQDTGQVTGWSLDVEMTAFGCEELPEEPQPAFTGFGVR